MNEHLRRAMEALETGASEVREVSLRSAGQVRAKLQATVEEVLQHLEADEIQEPAPDDVMGHLHRQSQDIAEDLQRVDRLMKQRTRQDQ